MIELTISDLEVIKESLHYSKKNINESKDHSYESRLEKLKPVEDVVAKINDLIKMENGSA